MNEEIKKLHDAEELIRDVDHARDKCTMHIAVAFAIIRRDRMFLEVASSWKEYVKQERTGIKYKETLRLADIGEKYLTFRPLLEENGILFSENMSKIGLIDPDLAANDPAFFVNFKKLSYRGLKNYIENTKWQSGRYDSGSQNGENLTVNGASLFVGHMKVKGINLNECRREAEAGKVAVLVWASDSAEARRIKRRLGK